MKKNRYGLNESQLDLLKLVRLGIGNSFEGDKGLREASWNDVFELSLRQGVPAIAYDGIEQLYQCRQSNNDFISLDTPMFEGVKYGWFGQSFSMEVDYEKYENAIAHLAHFYNSHGIDMMLLKGYGLSLNYPNPKHRPCGDVDIWLFGRQEEADSLLKEETGITATKSSHHTIFFFDGEEIENHITFFEEDVGFGWKNNQIVQKLFSEKSLEISIQGERVLLPSVNLNAFFLLKHSAGHFATENITVRHLLDWAFFVEKNHDRINWELLYDNAKRRNIHLFLDCQNAICIDYLGFNPDHFPIMGKGAKYKYRVLHEILSPSFTDKIPRMRDDFFRYCCLKAKRNMKNRWKYRITQKENFWLIFFRAAKNRLLHPYSFSDLVQAHGNVKRQQSQDC